MWRTMEGGMRREGHMTTCWNSSLFLTFSSGIFLYIKSKAYSTWLHAHTPCPSVPIFTPRLCLEYLLLLIFPYPGLPGSLTLLGRRKTINEDWVQTEYKYTLSEVFLVISFFRIVLLYAYLLETNQYCDSLAVIIRGQNRVNLGNWFAVKVYFAVHPVKSILILIVPILTVCSLTITIFERPLSDITIPEWDFYPYGNAAWLAAESVLSLNFGDLVPVSHFSRLAALMCGVLGVILVSAIVQISRRRTLRLTPEQLTSLAIIEYQRKAHKAILCAYRYYKSKRISHLSTLTIQYIKFQRAIKAFKQCRNKSDLLEDFETYKEVWKELETIRGRVKKIVEITSGK